MSFESAQKLFTTMWYSLDDIFVCVGFFLVVKVFAEHVNWCLQHYFDTSQYTAHALHFSLMFSSIIFLVGHLIGQSTATSLFSGFSIGLGYAMQPYIVSLLSGFSFRSGVIFSKEDSEKISMKIQGEVFELDHIGLLHVCAISNDGYKTYFPNSILGSSIISIKRSKNE